jgi:hypothetical protein
MSSDPLVKAPVVKETEPRSPEIKPPPLNPFTAISVDPESVSPAFVPDNVPPPLLKSVPLVARAGLGSIRQERKSRAGNKDLLEKLIGTSSLNKRSSASGDDRSGDCAFSLKGTARQVYTEISVDKYSEGQS